MNIAFDATAILGETSRNRGIGNYALSQFKTMLAMDQENKYFCINFFNESIFGDETERFENLKECMFWGGRDRFLFADPYYVPLFRDLLQRFIKNNAIDVFYVTSPFDGSTVPYQKSWFGSVPVVATVYDIIPYVMKEMYLYEKNTHDWYMRCVESVKQFDKYLTISGSVKDDLMAHFHINGDKIEVIHGAASGIYKKITLSDEEKTALCQRFNITGAFIMCTGGDDERKNIKGIIEAYARLPRPLIEAYQLVIVCKLSTFAVQLYTDVIASRKLDDRVILTNYVPDDVLLQLYNLASLMAFPSKYEGFGLPVAEAFACGVPVLTSNNSSLKEIAQGAAVLVDPFSIKDIAKGLEAALNESDRARRIQKGYEKVAFYTWEKVASLAIQALNALPRPQEEADKKKIAYFSPLPPIESGISDYSVDILSGLSTYFDIDVFTDDGYEADCPLPGNIRVFNHQVFKETARKYDSIVYHMGNSHFHTYMYPYIKKYPGVVVLHDYNLHGVAYSYAVAIKKNYDLYREYLLEDFPADAAEQMLTDLVRSGKHQHDNDIEINGFITNYTDRLIVHSEEAKEKLLKKKFGRNVRVIRSYAKIEPLVEPLVESPPKETFVIASFGHIHETKRSLLILKAFHRLSKQYDHLHYYFVGKMDTALGPAFEAYMEKNHLQDRVTVTGYIGLDAFNEYMAAADLCVNLRYPYNGETSGSLMRILGKGKCVIVNDIGSFGEVPDDCCVKIPSADTMAEWQEIDCICEAMEQLVTQPVRRETIAKAARRYAEVNLSLEKIAGEYRDALMDRYVPSINEEAVQNIKDYELSKKNYTAEETRRLSRTLAYTLR